MGLPVPSWMGFEAWMVGMPMVPVPSVEEGDARRQTRGRDNLLKERLRYRNPVKGLLAGQGIYDFEPLGADLMRDIAETAHE